MTSGANRAHRALKPPPIVFTSAVASPVGNLFVPFADNPSTRSEFDGTVFGDADEASGCESGLTLAFMHIAAPRADLRETSQQWLASFGMTNNGRASFDESLSAGLPAALIAQLFRPHGTPYYLAYKVELDDPPPGVPVAAIPNCCRTWDAVFPGVVAVQDASPSGTASQDKVFLASELECIASRAFSVCAAERARSFSVCAADWARSGDSEYWSARLMHGSQYLRQPAFRGTLSEPEELVEAAVHAYALLYTVLLKLGVNTSLPKEEHAPDRTTVRGCLFSGKAHRIANNYAATGMNLSIPGMADPTDPLWGNHYRRLDELLALLAWHGTRQDSKVVSLRDIAYWVLTDMAAGARQDALSAGTDACPSVPWFAVLTGFGLPWAPHYIGGAALDMIYDGYHQVYAVLASGYADAVLQQLLGFCSLLVAWIAHVRHRTAGPECECDAEAATSSAEEQFLIPAALVAPLYCFVLDPRLCDSKQTAMDILLAISLKPDEVLLTTWRMQPGSLCKHKCRMPPLHAGSFCTSNPDALWVQDSWMALDAENTPPATPCVRSIWKAPATRFRADRRWDEVRGLREEHSASDYALEWRHLRSTLTLAVFMGAERYFPAYHGAPEFATSHPRVSAWLVPHHTNNLAPILDVLLAEVELVCSPVHASCDVACPVGVAGLAAADGEDGAALDDDRSTSTTESLRTKSTVSTSTVRLKSKLVHTVPMTTVSPIVLCNPIELAIDSRIPIISSPLKLTAHAWDAGKLPDAVVDMELSGGFTAFGAS